MRETQALPSNLIRVVLDTNCYVASLFNKRSHSHKLYRMALAGGIAVLWSQEIWNEVKSVLAGIERSAGRKSILPELKEEIFRSETKVQELPELERISEDPSDDKFLVCAIAGCADFVVSADKHLLRLEEFQGIPILTASRAYRRIKDRLGGNKADPGGDTSK